MNTTARLSPSHTERGYTLLEMLVVLAIIVITVPVVYAAIQALYHVHESTLARAMAVTETTRGVQEMVRDVRSAVYAENGSLPIVALATSSLTIYADTDLDGVVERVRYFLDGTTVRKGIIKPTGTSSYPVAQESVASLIPNIINTSASTSLFRYYTATGTEIVTPSASLAVRRVDVVCVARSTKGTAADAVTIASSASIRNLKDSY